MDATNSILSSGRIACELQQPITRIMRAAGELGIVPIIVINNVPHFDASDVEKIADQLAAQSEHRPEADAR